jgi:hypothetical protein
MHILHTNINVAILPICFCILLAGCNEHSSSEASAPTPADPVAKLRELASTIPEGKTFHLADADIENYYQQNPMAVLGEKYYQTDRYSSQWGYSYRVDSMDVQKTDSLMSPYTGYLVLQERSDHYSGGVQVRVTLAWQNNRWVGKQVEYLKGGNWREWGGYPETRLVKRIVSVNWE